MRYLFTSFLLLIIKLNLFSQNFSTTVSNYFKAGIGYEYFGEARYKQKKNYFENYSDVRIFSPLITLGLRLEYSKPPEFGFDTIGIRKKFIEFERSGLNIRAGDFYALFGKGLSLNLFENRNLAFDNGLDGLRIKYENDFLRAQLIGGDLNFIDPLNIYFGTTYIEYYKVRASSVELNPIRNLSFGGSILWAEGRPIVQSPLYNKSETHLPELFLKFKFSGLDFFATYSKKRTAVDNKDSSKGSGFYSAISYSGDGYGITLEYKDYRFDIVEPNLRTFITRPTRALPFQNPPIVHKEHIFTLTQRYPHVTDFNDEVGFQLDVFFAITDNLNLNTNFALASRHYEYEQQISPWVVRRKENNKSFLPSLKKELAPFWEIYFDFEYFFPDEIDSYLRLAFNRRSEILDVLFQNIRITTIPLEVQKTFNDYITSKFTSESQWVYESAINQKFYNHFFGISTTFFSKFTIGFRYELTTNKFEEKKSWLVFESGYRFETNHTLIVSYGSERGGTICTNGICRIVNPFNGFRLTLTSNI